jgi:epoxyqueuosine reductase
MNSQVLIAQAQEFGASLAGAACVADLKKSNSYELYRTELYYAGCGEIVWPQDARSLLVMALELEPSEPRLDWWGQIEGRTLGNRRLMELAESMAQWLLQEHGIEARPLPYHVEKGGVFLKDSAALAGLGVIGKNNLLVTPEFGPRVRLRALFLDLELQPTGPSDFNPCEGCDMRCRSACPRKAFESGSYYRPLCLEMMGENEEHDRVLVEDWAAGLPFGEAHDKPGEVVKYCRACELACPVARRNTRKSSDLGGDVI